jgi:2-amino-4-hydroxy-6-hydroxymethyldihydropteridine diphosphokinase
METIYLSLGTNMGNKPGNLKTALRLISGLPVVIEQISSIYATEPVGLKTQPDFYNICVRGSTAMTPFALLEAVKKIELEMGRVKQEKWGPRIIDIDILFYSNIIINHEVLTIPHPEIASRRFVLEPLFEIAPLFVHPGRGITIKELLTGGVFTESAVRTGESI